MMYSFKIEENEKRREFYERFLPRVNPQLTADDILQDNNDGVLNGNILEFKSNVTNLDEHLFQCIKYLSARRIKGKPIPAAIIIIDLSSETAWYFKSEKYLPAIEKMYWGAASKNNSDFIGSCSDDVLHYGKNDLDVEKLISLLKQNKFTKINIDENCIVGWATAFYNTVPNARKEDFLGDDSGVHKTIGEIRKPKVFNEYIYPYKGETNIKFKYLMDKLNDTLLKKNTGAFYTHELYAEKSLELVRKAIDRVPKGNDYIILDRCAGTGNLEDGLTDEELSHCIVSTVEYYEYKVLQESLGSKVRHIIPPIETEDTFNAGLVLGADALSKIYIDNPVIRQYIDNPNCTIILFENPPYIETTSLEHQRKKQSKKSSLWKKSYVAQEMKKEIKGVAVNDLGNVFIWSGFKYYLRQPTDSYIVYSPVKYWKAQHLIDKEFIDGFAFNRRHFHTKINACVMCALWGSSDANNTTLNIEGYDILKDSVLSEGVSLPIKKINSLFSAKYYDKTPFHDASYDGILTGLDGLEADSSVKRRIKPMYSPNMLGYLVADSVGFDNPDAKSSLLVAGRYNGNGFYLHKDNFLDKLPMFAASRYISYNKEWTERSRIMKSSDGSIQYFNDVKNGKLSQFLLKVLLFTTLESQNHMQTFTGSDGRFYKNELCLDSTNGETIATLTLKELQMQEKEIQLINQWNTVLSLAKQTKKYNPNLTYGIHQISTTLDTFRKDEISGKTIWDYKELHTALQSMRTLVKKYYNSEIVPVLFKYEFLK